MHRRELSRALTQFASNETWSDAPDRALSLNELSRRLRVHSRQLPLLQNLNLDAPDRRIVHYAVLRERGPLPSLVDIYTLDHALLFVRENTKCGIVEMYKPPIPLDLLLMPPDTADGQRQSTSAPITFVHRGRNSSITLLARSTVVRTGLLDQITAQQAILWQQRAIFKLVRFLPKNATAATCVAPLDKWKSALIATHDGIYRHDRLGERSHPYKVLASSPITSIDVAENWRLLFVLSENTLSAFPLDSLSREQPISPHRHSQVISNMTSFFMLGIVFGKMVVAVVRSRPLDSYIKLYEIVNSTRLPSSLKAGPDDTLVSFSEGSTITIKFMKRIEHPIEISWIRLGSSKISIGCSKGISLVDIQTLYTQDLIDPHYAPSSPLARIESGTRPLGMFRIDSEFLLCYESMAFFVSAGGGKALQSTIIYWEGEPTAFALRAPYIFAFSASFVEIRHLGTGELAQTLHGANMRCLSLPSELRGTAGIGDAAPPPYRAQAVEMVHEDLLLLHSNDDIMNVQRLGVPLEPEESSTSKPLSSPVY
ncbi:CNH-domain-containing protein [Auriculariales sp. MPI-PUGE-AT-0066]|nr:CNH-domain-containing protein [Auriculariales sp. MPI-PUGE-AT-0066]